MKYNYIPSPLTIYESTFKIPQSSYLILDLDKFVFKRFNNFNNFCNAKAVTITKWWSLKNIKKTKDSEKKLSENEVLNDFETLLDKSVKKQLISDVPIGAFLSGGVDSSLILSQLIKSQNKKTVIRFKNYF